MVKKKLIEGGCYVKGKNKPYTPTKKRAPYGVRGKYKKQDTSKCKKYTFTKKRVYPKVRGKYKKQDPSKRKKYTKRCA